jgi:Zn-dependent protease
VVVPLATLLLGGILFGWAKPVPVNFNHLRHPKRDMFCGRSRAWRESRNGAAVGALFLVSRRAAARSRALDCR